MERPLDCIESGLKYFHDIGPSMLVAKVFFLSSDRPITKQKLEDAMTIIANIHPLLRMCINTDKTGVLRWGEMEETRLDIRLDITEDWHSVLANVLKGKYDVENGPLWNLTLMPNTVSEFDDHSTKYHVTLIFGYLHSIANAGGR